MKNKTSFNAFFIVPISIFPFLIASSLFLIVGGAAMTFQGCTFGHKVSYFGLALLIVAASNWWFSMIRESFLGFHTKNVQENFRIAMLLFIISEVMFFFGFFWGFFHISLYPSFYIGEIWPPKNLVPLNPWSFPLLNTLLLLTSGATVTISHHLLLLQQQASLLNSISTNELNKNTPQIIVLSKIKDRLKKNLTYKPSQEFITYLSYTLALAFIFTMIQSYEYYVISFSMESIFGSLFFLLTGFHGIHVIGGTLFLLIYLIRYEKGLISINTVTHFELAVWYWHFVDIIWIFLFIFLYWWGG